jgi:very-short-patch-repair endonuclease
LPERSFRRFSLDELNGLCERHKFTPAILSEILDELSHRGSRRAQILRDQYMPLVKRAGPSAQDPDDVSLEAVLSADPDPHTETADGADEQLRAALDRIRRKLLDLTLRNPLLNFTSRRTAIRVVDDLPDQLYRDLVGGGGLKLRPIPGASPRRQPNLEPLEGSPGFFGEQGGATAAPKSRARWGRGIGENPHSETSLLEAARRAGVDPKLDLPIHAAPAEQAADSRGRDRQVHVFHLPEQLAKIGGKLVNEARLLLEETGCNILQVSFGALEWRDSPGGTVRYAPLLLLPAVLSREVGGRREFTFTLRQADEDPVSNTSLQEKMREEFGIVIPDFGEGDTPASYFAAVQEAIATQPQWQVAGHVTIGLLDFGKMLMYKDLDATKWPHGRSPLSHPLIKRIFGGSSGAERGDTHTSPPTAEEAVDSAFEKPDAPLLIRDADSSQCAAIVDAMAGVDMVIQGPPGTGKSQTISNLIAAGMAAGKRILFVAEKRAALAVVKDRLAEAGLGELLLELHSDRVRKKVVAERLAARLDYSRKIDPTELEARRQDLRRQQSELTKYAKLLAAPVGAAGIPLQTVLWEGRRAARALGEASDALDSLTMDGAQNWTDSEVKGLRELCSTIATLRKSVDAHRDSHGIHPWEGVPRGGVTEFDMPRLKNLATAVVLAATEVQEVATRLQAITGTDCWGSPVELGHVEWLLNELEQAPLPLSCETLPALRDAREREALSGFLRQAGGWQQAAASMEADYPAALASRSHHGALASAWSRLPMMRPQVSLAQGFEQEVQFWRDATNTVSSAVRLVARLGEIVPDGRLPRLHHLQDCQVVIAGLEGVSPGDSSLRTAGLRSPNAQQVLADLAAAISALRATRDELASRLRLELAPSGDRVKEHLGTIASTGVFGRLGSRYRAARRAHRTMARASRTSHSEALADLDALHAYLIAESKLLADAGYREVCGVAFRGLDTPVSTLARLCEWGHGLARHARERPNIGAVWGASDDEFALLCETAAERAHHDTLLAANELLADPRFVSLDVPAGESLDAVRTRCEAAKAALTDLDHALRAAQWPEQLLIDSVPDILARVTRLSEVEDERRSDTRARHLLGSGFAGVYTDVDAGTRLLAAASCLAQAAAAHPLAEFLWHPDFAQRVGDLRGHVGALRDAVLRLATAEGALLEQLSASPDDWYRDGTSAESRPFIAISKRAARALHSLEELPVWLSYQHRLAECQEAGLGALLTVAEDHSGVGHRLDSAFDYAFRRSLVKQCFADQPELARFRSESLERVRQRYVELDHKLLEASRGEVAVRSSVRSIPAGRDWGPVATHTGLALVEREARKERKHVALRQLVSRAGDALQGLFPCWMMSPISLARFCAPGDVEFDMVIMDEASQLRPEDTLGAIARAKQIVVVGDPKQLPPTSFFDTSSDWDGDAPPPEEDLSQGVADAESILDVAAPIFRPMRLLRWHYRSRHDSLIAFSNRQFYEDRLIFFPSPYREREALGVHFEYVPDGCYRSSLNHPEARRVLELLLRHCRERPERSVGVVVMNVQQRDLLQELLAQAILDDPVLQDFVEQRAEGLDSLIIKNLENIQGDERDEIIIGITYGPDENRNVYHRFGPINGPAGPRRLNVLFTRARERVLVVSSLRAADIRAEASTSEGTRVLKAYLEYAETGRYSDVTFSGREPDSPFELEVADCLRGAGYEVVAQLGVAGYFLDIAVRHPDRPGEFLMAVECDGATFHSSRSARDRDRLRQEQLEALGWRIHRIYSTDWFMRPRAEFQRLCTSLASARNGW